MFVNGAYVSSFSRAQATEALSSCEAELYVANAAIAEGLFLVRVCKFLCGDSKDESSSEVRVGNEMLNVVKALRQAEQGADLVNGNLQTMRHETQVKEMQDVLAATFIVTALNFRTNKTFGEDAVYGETEVVDEFVTFLEIKDAELINNQAQVMEQLLPLPLVSIDAAEAWLYEKSKAYLESHLEGMMPIQEYLHFKYVYLLNQKQLVQRQQLKKEKENQQNLLPL
eukprot:s1227_g16.t1